MKRDLHLELTPHLKLAIKELQELIRGRYPSAAFEVSRGEGDDLDGWYLTVTVDIPDTDEVMDLVIDRLLHYQIDDDLPIYLIPVQPLERVAEQLQARAEPPLVTQIPICG